MQKDIQKSKGETQQQKFDQPKQEATSKEGHKLKQVGHDINAGLKENVGVGVGNYSSGVDREKSEKHEKKYDEKKEKEELKKKGEKFEKKGERIGERRDQKEGETGPLSHKVQEIGHTVNANLKQNVGIGLGNYSSEVDREKATEHRVKYEDKKEVEKEKLEEKKEEMKEKFQGGETGIYGHRLQEVGHTLNANLKENIGIGIGDYSSEVDRQKATEHRELYEEKVKEECKPEVTDSSTIGHKIKEVAHTVNANLKEMIGIGLGNYSSEVDRELASIHKEKYEEKVQTTTKHEDFPKEGECKDREFKDRESKNLESKDRESKDREFKDRESKDRESKNLESKDRESKNLESKNLESKDRKKEETCLHNDDKCTHTKEERGLHSKEAKFDDKQKTGSGDNKL